MFYYQVLKKIRKGKKINAEELAKIVNKSRFTVSRWERGIIQPNDADIRIIAQYLGIDVREISDLTPLPIKEVFPPSNDTKAITSRNITLNKLSKEELFKRYTELLAIYNTQQSKRKDYFVDTKIVLNSLSNAVIIIDANYKVRHYNDVIYKYTDKKNLVLYNIDISVLFPGKFTALLKSMMQDAIYKNITDVRFYGDTGIYFTKIQYMEHQSVLFEIKDLSYMKQIDISDYSNHSLLSRKYKNDFIALFRHECPDTCFFCLHNNESLKYVFLSESVKNILGLSKKEFTSNRFKWLDRIHPDDAENCRKLMLNEHFPKVYIVRYDHPTEGYIKIFLTSYLSNDYKYRYGYVRRLIEIEPNSNYVISDSIKNSLGSLLIYESDNR